MLGDDEDECLYSDESVKYDEDDDKNDEMSRVVDEEINSTVSNRLKRLGCSQWT